MENISTIGERVQHLREMRAMSRNDLVHDLNSGLINGERIYNSDHIRNLENGSTESPKPSLLEKLTQIFNVNADWLLFGTGPMFKDVVKFNDLLVETVKECKDDLPNEKYIRLLEVALETSQQLNKYSDRVDRITEKYQKAIETIKKI